MYHLLKVFFDILLLRRGPQALPASELLLGIVIALHFLLGVTLGALSLPLADALLAAMVGTALVLILVYGALALRGMQSRFVQTATAMGGVEFLLALITLPFAASHQESGGIASIVGLLVLGWSVAIAAHIFRHALDLSPWLGFAAAMLYILISYSVAGLFVGPGA